MHISYFELEDFWAGEQLARGDRRRDGKCLPVSYYAILERKSRCEPQRLN
jgi:hypothetical protein